MREAFRLLLQMGFSGSFDAFWSEWRWIIDPDPDHPKGTYPQKTVKTWNFGVILCSKEKAYQNIVLCLHFLFSFSFLCPWSLYVVHFKNISFLLRQVLSLCCWPLSLFSVQLHNLVFNIMGMYSWGVMKFDTFGLLLCGFQIFPGVGHWRCTFTKTQSNAPTIIYDVVRFRLTHVQRY